MENQTKNTSFAEQTVDKNQYQAFNPKATLLLDVLPAENVKPAASKPGESPEKLLQVILPDTRAPAEWTQFTKRKWQLVSLVMAILLIAAVALIGWLYMETSATATLQVENQSLREQLNLAGSQITGLKTDMEALLNRNTELVTENTKLKLQNISPAASRPAAASRQSASKGTTKAELIAAMGKPDRVYNARGYEQLVYFGKNPGRFWLIDGHVVRSGG
jgi:regulator of replication initiation timing